MKLLKDGFSRSEREEQEILIRWARLAAQKDPRLARLFHVPNGGWRHPATAARMKRAGVMPGVPDLLMPVPSREYVGMAIEMKSRDGKVSPDQRDWLNYLESVGWCVVVCYSFKEAREEICKYLGLKRKEVKSWTESLMQ